MTKKTILELNSTARRIPGYADEIVQDYEKASNEWSKILSDSKSKTVDGLASLINDEKETFMQINQSRTWEDAMVWNAFLYYYDAQTGLNFENGMHAQRILDAFLQSDCSSYVKRTAEYAYYVLRDKGIGKG